MSEIFNMTEGAAKYCFDTDYAAWKQEGASRVADKELIATLEKRAIEDFAPRYASNELFGYAADIRERIEDLRDKSIPVSEYTQRDMARFAFRLMRCAIEKLDPFSAGTIKAKIATTISLSREGSLPDEGLDLFYNSMKKFGWDEACSAQAAVSAGAAHLDLGEIDAAEKRAKQAYAILDGHANASVRSLFNAINAARA